MSPISFVVGELGYFLKILKTGNLIKKPGVGELGTNQAE